MKNSWNTLPTLVALSVLAAINPANAQSANNIDEENIANISVSNKTKATKKEREEVIEEIEVIEVSGLRTSLIKASELKRTSNSIIDVLSAEDVGNFPDENVVESLQRVTGVQVIFGETGIAESFQIRGVSQNRIELNGRSVAGGEGSDPSRDVNLADFPSELIDTLEVIKSPTADKIEGSLGATINLKTKKPLSVEKDFLQVSGKARYGDEIEKVYPNLSAIGVKNWRDTKLGDFGAIVNLSFNDNRSRSNVIRTVGWGVNCPMYASNGTGNTTNQQGLCGEDDASLYRPNNMVFIDRFAQNEKTAFAATLQWEPNDSSSYTLDILQNDTLNHNIANVFVVNSQNNLILPEEELGADGTLYAFNNVQLGTEVTRTDNMGRFIDTVSPVTYFESDVGSLNQSRAQATHNTTKQTTIALKGEWELENLGIKADIARSKSDHERHYLQVGYNAYFGNPTNLQDQRLRVDDPSVVGTDQATAIRQTGTDLTVDLTDPRTVGISLANGLDPNDLRAWRVANFRDDGWNRETVSTSAKVDFDYSLDWGPIESIAFGARFAKDEIENSSRFQLTCNPNWSYGADGPNANSYNPDEDFACEEPISAVELAERYPGLNRTNEGFYSEAGDVPSWTAFDLDIYKDNRGLWNEISGFNDLGYEERQGENYTLSEEVSAAYLMANFYGEINDSIIYRGNMGVRAVRTKVSSETYNSVDEQGNAVPLNLFNEYDNVLPSLNLVVAHEDYGLVRFAAASTMVRPDLGTILPIAQLNNFTGCAALDPTDPFGVYNNAVPNPGLSQDQQDLQVAQQYAITNYYDGATDNCPGIRTSNTAIGNIELEAQTSDNIDLSFEHYWGEGNMLSLAFFHRKVNADVVYKRNILAVPTVSGTELLGIEGNGLTGENLLVGEDISSVPGYELWRTRTAYNGQGTTRKGIELGYTQWLDFLPGEWSGLGFALNYTYTEGTRPTPTFIDSSTEEELQLPELSGVSGYAAQRDVLDGLAALGDAGPLANGYELQDATVLLPIANMSKHSGNVSLFYDKGPINMRLATNYRSSYFSGGTLNWPLYYSPVTRVDFSSSYKVSKNFKVQFNINNLTKAISHRYRIDQQITDTSSYGDTTYSLGMSYRFQ